MQLLVEREVYPWADDSMLALFQKHFIVQHCLYELQTHFSNHRLHLHITPVHITLAAATAATPALADDGARQQIAAFYLDLENFYAATPDTVAQHLANFWRRVKKTEADTDAYTTLALKGDESWPDIQRRFRELAATTHPDKGGDAATFASIKAAYDALKAAR